MSDESSVELIFDHHVVAVTEMQYKGLRLVGYKRSRIKRAADPTNIERFLSHFGVSPAVCCTIYENLQRTAVIQARIENGSDTTLKWFLMALHFLRRYPTEDEREAIFDVSKPYGAMRQWEYVEKIQALKAEKIVWDDTFYVEEEDWIVSVDGTHCWIQEPGKTSFNISHNKLPRVSRHILTQPPHAVPIQGIPLGHKTPRSTLINTIKLA
jgi:prolyl oligopeptidase PreP (S9A serine peptidase family)